MNNRDLSGADRQRRYRQRIRDNKAVYPVELDHAALERLIDNGLLNEDSADVKAKVSQAVVALLVG